MDHGVGSNACCGGLFCLSKGAKTRHWMAIVDSDDEDSNDPDDAENSVLPNTHPPYKFRKGKKRGRAEEPMPTD